MTQQPGEARLPHLFRPGRIGHFATRNLIKYGACCVSNYNGRDGTITPRELARMRVIANTGCGMITNQGAYPDPRGEGKAYFRQVAIFDDRFLPEFETIARYIHDGGAIAIQQILHAGRYGGIDLGYCIQPSVVPQTLPHFRPPREMTKDDIRQCVREHADAAQRAIKAGFDGTEVTSFMGYLLANFNSKFTNQRTDEYGGSLANRMRLPLQVFEAVRAAVPAAMPVGVRLSATDWVDGGWDAAQSLVFARALQSRGLSFLHVSSGGVSAQQKIPIGPGYQVGLAEQLKRETGLPTLAVGLITEPRQAEAIVASGQADLVALARGMLFDPRWPWHAAAELGAQVDAPPQYWRSQPRGMSGLFGDVHIGMR